MKRAHSLCALSFLFFVHFPIHADPVLFQDDFNRPDGPIGNGWTLSDSPNNVGGQYGVVNGAATAVGTSPGGLAAAYRNLTGLSASTAPITVSAAVTGAVLTAPVNEPTYTYFTLFGDGTVGRLTPGVTLEFDGTNTSGLGFNVAVWMNNTAVDQNFVSLTPGRTIEFSIDPNTGIVTGVLDGTIPFSVEYDPTQLVSATDIFGFGQVLSNYPDTYPTLDNLQITYDDGRPSYACNGFKTPFDTSILLKPNVKRSIPLKVELFENGTPISDLNIAGDAPVVNISFSGEGGPAVDATDQLEPLGQSSDGNEFRFDTSAGHWVFNLGTKPFTSAGTYTVTAVPGDTNYTISPICTGQFVRSE